MTSDLRPLTDREKNTLYCLLNTYHDAIIRDLVSHEFRGYDEKAMAIATAELLVRRLQDGLVPPYTAEEIRATIPALY